MRLVCPAASPLHRPLDEMPSVLCGVLDKANDGAEVDGFRERGHVSPVIRGEQSRTVLATYCAGPGVTGSLCSYAACPVWRAAREADWAGRRGPDALQDGEALRPPAVRDELTIGG